VGQFLAHASLCNQSNPTNKTPCDSQNSFAFAPSKILLSCQANDGNLSPSDGPTGQKISVSIALQRIFATTTRTFAPSLT